MARNLTITEWLVVANLVMYILLAIIGLSAFILNDTVLVFVAQYNRFIFERGYLWELITALYVHFNIGHLLSNMIFLLLFGYRAEDFFNWKEYLLIFLVSGLAGNLLGLILGPEFLSAGASGSVFGIFGAILYPIKRESPRSMKSMIFLGIIFLIFAGLNYNVDHLSHWAGFIIGFVLGKYYFQRKKKLRKITAEKLYFKRNTLSFIFSDSNNAFMFVD